MAVQPGLCGTWSVNPEDRFSDVAAQVIACNTQTTEVSEVQDTRIFGRVLTLLLKREKGAKNRAFSFAGMNMQRTVIYDSSKIALLDCLWTFPGILLKVIIIEKWKKKLTVADKAGSTWKIFIVQLKVGHWENSFESCRQLWFIAYIYLLKFVKECAVQSNLS